MIRNCKRCGQIDEKLLEKCDSFHRASFLFRVVFEIMLYDVLNGVAFVFDHFQQTIFITGWVCRQLFCALQAANAKGSFLIKILRNRFKIFIWIQTGLQREKPFTTGAHYGWFADQLPVLCLVELITIRHVVI